MTSPRPVIAVLTGGRSSRMGRDKATIEVSGRTMLDTILQVAVGVGDPLVVGPGPGPEGIPCTADLRPGRQGPLAGLEAALAWASGRDVVLLAVDQPFLRSPTVVHLLDEAGDAVVPDDEGWLQVTCAVYRAACLPEVRASLDAGERSLLAILDRVDTRVVGQRAWRRWGEDGRSWFSADTPDRLAEGLARYT
jgi:molybdopterin-guanine dinucleotide biosynthesis protein A